MASKNNSKKPPSNLFPWPDSEMAYIKCDIVIYVWYIFYFLCYTYVWNINSPKICICNHSVFFIKVAYLHPWDGFCYLKNASKTASFSPSPPSSTLMITFAISGWSKHIFQEFISKGFIFGNMQSGPFGTTRNEKEKRKGH